MQTHNFSTTRSGRQASLLTACAAALLLTAPVANAAPAARLLNDQGTQACAAGTVGRVPSGPFAGVAKALFADKLFSEQHAKSMNGEDVWLLRFAGLSTRNFLFNGKRGARVVVAAVCPASGCAETRAYVAWFPGERQYGATVIEGRQLREVIPGAEDTTLAMHPDVVNDALICARELAERTK